MQVARQLEMEKAALLEAKRREQEERRRKQEELDQILLENRRKVQPGGFFERQPVYVCKMPPGVPAVRSATMQAPSPALAGIRPCLKLMSHSLEGA